MSPADPAPFPAPAAMAEPEHTGGSDAGQAAEEGGGAGMEEPRLSREAPGKSERREEPE